MLMPRGERRRIGRSPTHVEDEAIEDVDNEVHI